MPRSVAVAAAATGEPDLAQRGLWVVKLGGSLSQSRYLNRWLSILAAAGGAVVIVPGGGPFADQVRDLQKRRRFDDATAHHMALLAMEQYGRMLAGLQPGLRPAASRAEIARARRAGLAAVWMPTRMVLAEPGIATSWDITSDSLAAWLAGQLKADRLVLVKSVALPGSSVSATILARRGIVDPAFPAYLARSGSDGWCIDDARYAAMATALKSGHGPGTQIVAAPAPTTRPRRLPVVPGVLTSRPDRRRTRQQ
jgi:5-(aminomethyl)-3-furanmethanol phosphate kinase